MHLCPQNGIFHEVIFQGHLFMRSYPSCASHIAEMPGIHLLRGILAPGGGRAQSPAEQILSGMHTTGSIPISLRKH